MPPGWWPTLGPGTSVLNSGIGINPIRDEAGLPTGNVLQVAAQADGMPLLPNDPENGANRRIELLLLTSQAEGLYRELFGEAQVRAEVRAEGVKLSVPES